MREHDRGEMQRAWLRRRPRISPPFALLDLPIAANTVRSLSRLRGGVGVGVSPRTRTPRGESPHPARCADLSRKRERLSELAAQSEGIPTAVPQNWLSRAKIRIAPIDDGVVADEQSTIDLYFRWGLIKQKLDAAEIVDRSFAEAIAKAGL